MASAIKDPSQLQFSDGNVEIRLSKNDKVVLHSYVLALHSRWFRASLSQRWNPDDHRAQTQDKDNERWVYELRFGEHLLLGQLFKYDSQQTRKEKMIDHIDDKPTNSNQEKICHMVANAMRLMFKLFYHLPEPLVDESCLIDVVGIVSEISKFYQCEQVIHRWAELQLHGRRDNVLQLCKSQPAVMLQLAASIHCPWIFKEAAGIAIGRESQEYNKILDQITVVAVKMLIAAKRKTFFAMLRDCDHALLALSLEDPGMLEGNRLLALAYFHQLIVAAMKSRQGPRLDPDYAEVYWVIRYKCLTTEGNKSLIDEWLRALGVVHRNAARKHEIAKCVAALYTKAEDIIHPILDGTPPPTKDNGWYVHKELRTNLIEDCELPWVNNVTKT